MNNNSIEDQSMSPVKGSKENTLLEAFKKRKVLIIILIILLLIFVAVGIYVFSMSKPIEETEEEQAELPFPQSRVQVDAEARSIGIETDEGKKIVLKNVPNSIDDTEYVLVNTDEESIVFQDNYEGYGSTTYLVEYYMDSEDLFGDGSLETVVVDEDTYVYLSKSDGEDSDGSGVGRVYNREADEVVNDYPAYQLINYYNPSSGPSDSSSGDFKGLDQSTWLGSNCAFKLKDIADDLKGAIVFIVADSGASNACEVLGPEFEISVEDPIEL